MAMARCRCSASGCAAPTKPVRKREGGDAVGDGPQAQRRPARAAHRPRGWCGAAESGRTAGSGRDRGIARAGGCAPPAGVSSAGGPNSPCGNSSMSARRPRRRAARSSSSRKVPWLIMIWRDSGSVCGSRRVRSQYSVISSGRLQVHPPGLQVVRMRRQDRVAQDPAAHVALDRGRHLARPARLRPGSRWTANSRPAAAAPAGAITPPPAMRMKLRRFMVHPFSSFRTPPPRLRRGQWLDCGNRRPVPQLPNFP